MTVYSIEKSAFATFCGIVALFSTAILVVLIAPRHIDPTWTQPTSSYQVQMYEIADPNIYIGSSRGAKDDLQFVYHLKDKLTLLSFQESEFIRIITNENLERYITKLNDPVLKLSSKLLLLKKPENEMIVKAEEAQKTWLTEWEENHPNWEEEKVLRPYFQVLELYQPDKNTAFSLGTPDTILSEWVDSDFIILDEEGVQPPRANDPGIIFVKNPIEYKVSFYNHSGNTSWTYNPNGEKIEDLQELTSEKFGFRSRKELIEYGEHLYNIEGCWYCHTDQTRTLIQDTVLNGSGSFPAPPSSANEYIYQNVSFPGTRRIGPDISRTGVKRPSRDWHRGHFMSPKTASIGSVMPSFHHFFDEDPRGTSPNSTGVPNFKFEAIYQYLMTKGTRITPPNQGWWLGKDPVNTKEIIEGLKR